MIRQSNKIIGTYLVKLSALQISARDSAKAAMLLKVIGDLERISDHALNIMGAAEEIKDKKLDFSSEAKKEMTVLITAVNEILDITYKTFSQNDLQSAVMVEPLEQVVDELKEYMRRQHVRRLRKNECTVEMGFIQTDLLTDIERISDHCSNIAACILEMAHDDMDMHKYLNRVKAGKVQEYNQYYEHYVAKYAIK